MRRRRAVTSRRWSRVRADDVGILVPLGLALLGAFYEWGGAAGRGYRELREKKYREAATSLSEARRDLPRSAAVRYDEALALQGAGEADSAAAAYAEAAMSANLRGDEARAAAAYNLGNRALAGERFEDAIARYRQSLRLDPTRVDAKKNLEEAIRRARAAQSPPASGGAGAGAPQPSGGGGASPPSGGLEPPGGPQPETSRPQGDSPRLGSEIPSRAEAEHWLDALEDERRAARQRERREEDRSRGGRDW